MRTLSLALLLGVFGCSHAASPAVHPPLVSPRDANAPPAFTTHVSGKGRPVLFIPDLQAPGEVWDTTVQHLGERVEAHVVEIAGFAGNPATPGPLLPKLRDELARYIRERKLKRPVIVGHLLGATVAYWLAMTEPDLVGGVVVVDTPPSRGDGSAEGQAEAAEGRQSLAEASPEGFARMVTSRLASMMRDGEHAKRVAAKAVRSSQPAVAEAFYDMMTRDLHSQIPKIRAPVLVILTTENFPPEAFPEIDKAFEEQLAPIPKHELVVVRGSKHYVMFDAPEAFFGSLDRFLKATQ